LTYEFNDTITISTVLPVRTRLVITIIVQNQNVSADTITITTALSVRTQQMMTTIIQYLSNAVRQYMSRYYYYHHCVACENTANDDIKSSVSNRYFNWKS